MIVQPRLASAVMLLRDRALAGQDPGQGQAQPVPYTGHDTDGGPGQRIEVFMVRRVISSDFMPDVYVFPGGSVSRDDATAELSEGVCAPVALTSSDPEGRTALGKGIRAAAMRELFEEAGVLLAYREGAILSISEEQVQHFEAYRQDFQERKG